MEIPISFSIVYQVSVFLQPLDAFFVFKSVFSNGQFNVLLENAICKNLIVKYLNNFQFQPNLSKSFFPINLDASQEFWIFFNEFIINKGINVPNSGCSCMKIRRSLDLEAFSDFASFICGTIRGAPCSSVIPYPLSFFKISNIPNFEIDLHYFHLLSQFCLFKRFDLITDLLFYNIPYNLNFLLECPKFILCLGYDNEVADCISNHPNLHAHVEIKQALCASLVLWNKKEFNIKEFGFGMPISWKKDFFRFCVKDYRSDILGYTQSYIVLPDEPEDYYHLTKEASTDQIKLNIEFILNCLLKPEREAQYQYLAWSSLICAALLYDNVKIFQHLHEVNWINRTKVRPIPNFGKYLSLYCLNNNIGFLFSKCFKFAIISLNGYCIGESHIQELIKNIWKRRLYTTLLSLGDIWDCQEGLMEKTEFFKKYNIDPCYLFKICTRIDFFNEVGPTFFTSLLELSSEVDESDTSIVTDVWETGFAWLIRNNCIVPDEIEATLNLLNTPNVFELAREKNPNFKILCTFWVFNLDHDRLMKDQKTLETIRNCYNWLKCLDTFLKFIDLKRSSEFLVDSPYITDALFRCLPPHQIVEFHTIMMENKLPFKFSISDVQWTEYSIQNIIRFLEHQPDQSCHLSSSEEERMKYFMESGASKKYQIETSNALNKAFQLVIRKFSSNLIKISAESLLEI